MVPEKVVLRKLCEQVLCLCSAMALAHFSSNFLPISIAQFANAFWIKHTNREHSFDRHFQTQFQLRFDLEAPWPNG